MTGLAGEALSFASLNRPLRWVVFVQTLILNLEEFNGYLVAFVHVSLFLVVLNTRSVFKDELDDRHASRGDCNDGNSDFSK
jgi:hypothetical protein